METNNFEEILMMRNKSHPWHGVSPDCHDPRAVCAYIEMVPADRVKKELDKATGHLKVDRPQQYAATCPTLYGFIPRTYCDKLVAKRCKTRTRRRVISGDLDPLDICVLSEVHFWHGDILLEAIPIGGLRMIDKKQADDKILAVLKDDTTYGAVTDLSQLPAGVISRLENYFLSYKRNLADKSSKQVVTIAEIYGAEEARTVIQLSREDYTAAYGTASERLEMLRQALTTRS